MSGVNRPERWLLGSARPVRLLGQLPEQFGGAMARRDISAIIWPLLAAVPNSCGSNGMTAIGSSSSALAKSAGLISGRFGTPTWLRQ